MSHSTHSPYLRLLLLLLAGSMLACRLVSEGFSVVATEPMPTTVAQETPAPSPQATATATASPIPSTATITPVPPAETQEANAGLATPTWTTSSTLPAPFSDAPLTSEQQRTAAELRAAAPPVRDDVALAMAYQGVTEAMLAAYVTPPPPEVGNITSFNVLNIDSNFNVPIEAELHLASEHAYFWFDTTLPRPEPASLQQAATAFDRIYEQNVANFGQESRPGIDGDERLHILNAAPGAICDDAARCGLLGYFSSSDALPRVVNQYSNERDMFVMNGERFGSESYIHVLAHEFRHMIEDEYDQSDADWEIEGSAMFAEDLAGFTFSALDRGNAFLENPDQQLNSWSDGNTYAYYGQGYVLNRYIYDRLGPDLYREFATNPADGLQAVTAVAQANGLSLDGESLWLDWLAALAIHRHPQAPEIYRLGDGSLGTAAMTAVSAPATYDTTVRQYAADYYRLQGNAPVTIQFAGAKQTTLLGIPAASGQQYWYAQRVNYSHMQLERSFDLSAVGEVTLNYDVYHDIEIGYDFAYVSISSDDGATWQGLVAQGMQGLQEDHDPGDAALTDRFYTGESEGWVRESIDLSPYAGETIRLRFSYITDPILTFGGLALDNISIPEIGFFDDAEAEVGGWQTQGFTRATATLPQTWHLQLITFPNGEPIVTPLEIDDTVSLTHPIDLQQSDGEAILVVAATAPMTLEEALYRLEIVN